MIELPSLTVLEFYDWLKKQMPNPDDEAIVSAFLRNSDIQTLRQKADEYINNKFSLNHIFQDFLKSDEFKKWSNVYANTLRNVDLCAFTENSLNCKIQFEKNGFYEEFVRYANNHVEQYKKTLSPEILVENITCFYDSKIDDPIEMQYMTALSSNLTAELNFLEWLYSKYNDSVNFCEMSRIDFEKIVNLYCKESRCASANKKKIMKSFKGSDASIFLKKLGIVLPSYLLKRMNGFGYRYKRYSSEDIPYRCIILPLANDGKGFKKFVKTFWDDLNNMSKDYLDIYYGKGDFGQSGYSIKNNLNFLPEYLSEELPCIVIWGDEAKEAKSICFRGLSIDELFELMIEIVECIKKKMSLEQIVMEANITVKKLLQKHIDEKRPNITTTINVENNTGMVAGVAENNTISMTTGSIDKSQFASETEKAIDIINSFNDVEKNIRDSMISILKEANNAVQRNDEKTQDNCKNMFKGLVMGAGKAVGGIITKLAELVTIATFFQFTGTIPPIMF